jgi:hypothetical protein
MDGMLAGARAEETISALKKAEKTNDPTTRPKSEQRQ